LKLLLNGASRNRQHADIAKDCGPPNVALAAYAYQEAVPLLLAIVVKIHALSAFVTAQMERKM
jgi:hypothetical protein